MITFSRKLNGLLPLLGFAARLRIVLSIVLCSALGALPQRADAAERPNVLLLCVDDLRPELNCYGVDYIRSPNIDGLAKQSGMFMRHYVQAPTCGASRYAMLTGRYGGDSNEALFQRAARLAAGEELPPSMPQWFRQHGYRAVSVGKVSHHPGGLGGADWDDSAQPEMPGAWDAHICPSGPWQHPRGFMHGLAHGQMREQAEAMDVFQSVAGDDSIYPDGLTTEEALRQIETLAADGSSPFFLAVGLLRPHLPFGAPAQYMQPYLHAVLPPIAHPHKPSGQSTWHNSGEFMRYHRWDRDPNRDAQFADEVRKHYAACVSYADAQVGRILERLAAVGARDNTIVVLWGDHGWHLGEHAVWGKHTLFDESLQAPLLISAPGTGSRAARKIDAIVETIDIFPTLCELAAVPHPEFVQGRSLAGLLHGDAGSAELIADRVAVSYFKQARSLRSERYRLIVHRNGHRELYDHQASAGETLNVADRWPQVCAELERLLDARYPAQPR